MARPPKAFEVGELGPSGRRLWQSVNASLPPEWTLDERDAEHLRLACHQADDLTRIEQALADSEVVTTGSRGQQVVNGLLSEARQARLAIGRLLAAIAVPQEVEADAPQSRRARQAAARRWAR